MSFENEKKEILRIGEAINGKTSKISCYFLNPNAFSTIQNQAEKSFMLTANEDIN